jgi:hypothetical protein
MSFYMTKKGRPRKVDTKSVEVLEFVATHSSCTDEQFAGVTKNLDRDVFKVALRIREIQHGRVVHDSVITRTAKTILESVK